MRNTTTLTSLGTDINLHWNDYDWIYVFDYFKKHPNSSYFATKWVNTKLLDYVPENKIRVRMSLMPENESYAKTVPVL
jgi:spore photoproduct lyase